MEGNIRLELTFNWGGRHVNLTVGSDEVRFGGLSFDNINIKTHAT